MAETSTFRGYWSIKEVVDNARPLVDFLRKNKPTCKHLTMRRKDYDLVRRWPKAAELHGFVVREGRLMYEDFEVSYDRSPARYEKQAETEQL